MKFFPVAFAALLPAVTACTAVQRVQPAEFIPKHSPEVVWVTTDNAVHTAVRQPQIVGDAAGNAADRDSLQGTRQDWTQLPIAISLKEINYVQAEVPSPKRTALLVTLVGATVTGLAYAIVTAEGCCSTSNCPVGPAKGTPTSEC